MSYLFLGHAVDDLRSHRVSHVSGQQGSCVVFGLNAGCAHLLPPGGHRLRVPGLVYSDCKGRAGNSAWVIVQEQPTPEPALVNTACPSGAISDYST